MTGTGTGGVMRITRSGWAALAAAGVLGAALTGCGDDAPLAATTTPPAATTAASRLPAPPDATSPAAGSMLPSTGLSVAEVLADTTGGPLVVQAFIVADADGAARLCDALAESFPPQCGGAAIEVSGLPLELLDGLEASGTVLWSEQPVQLIGSVKAGVFVNDPVALAAS